MEKIYERLQNSTPVERVGNVPTALSTGAASTTHGWFRLRLSILPGAAQMIAVTVPLPS